MGDYEILTARFAYYPGKRAVVSDVFPNCFPDRVENFGTPVK